MIASILKGIGKRMPRDRYSRGSLIKNGSPARWFGEWEVYRIVDGKEKSVHRGPKLLRDKAGKILLCSKVGKAEARAILERTVTADRQAKDQNNGAEITFGKLMSEYLELKRPTWADATAETADWICGKHLIPALGHLPLTQLTRVAIQRYINGLAATDKSHSTVHKAKTLIKAVLAQAVEDDRIAKNPARALDTPRTKQKTTRFLTEEEVGAILAVSSGRDHLILRLCMVCGLRPGELFGLKRDDVLPGRLRIDGTAREGKMRDGETKTESSVGFVPMPPSIEVEMHHWLETSPVDPIGLIFPSQRPGIPIRQKNYLRRTLKTLAKKADIEGVTFQSFRRTTATHMQDLGSPKDTQTIMRHASPHMTIGVYMQAIPDSVFDAAVALDEKLCKIVQ